ncbi:MAG: serine--tRNA ligase, partial [Burkholderiaceae bacterium]
MLDPNLLRKDLPAVVKALALRGMAFDVDRFNALESRRKALQVDTEALQARRNAVSKLIGQLKSKQQDASGAMAESQQIPARLKELETELGELQKELGDWLLTIPNLPHDSVPPGKDSDDNVEVRRWIPPGMPTDAQGNPAALPFPVRDHVAVGEPLGLDFDTARKISGSRFMMLRGSMARLHRALAQFMLDLQTTEHGYQECYTPYIVTASTLQGTGQLPKFKDDMFWVTKGGSESGQDHDEHGNVVPGEDLYLISTSEITLTAS